MPAPAASPLISLPAWQALGRHADAIRGVHLRDLFAKDPERAGRFSREAEGLFLPLDVRRIARPGVMKECLVSLKSGAQQVNKVPMVVADGAAVYPTAIRLSPPSRRSWATCRSISTAWARSAPSTR